MSVLERLTTGAIRPIKVTKKPSKWKLFKELANAPENFELRAFFEGDGITIRIEPHGVEQHD